MFKTRTHVLQTFIIHILVYMHQKEKITLEIAAKIVNGPLKRLFGIRQKKVDCEILAWLHHRQTD